jgi:hypothetical protein
MAQLAAPASCPAMHDMCVQHHLPRFLAEATAPAMSCQLAVAGAAPLRRTAAQAARGPLEAAGRPVLRAVPAAPAPQQPHLTWQQPTPQALRQLPLLLLMHLSVLLPRWLPCP